MQQLSELFGQLFESILQDQLEEVEEIITKVPAFVNFSFHDGSTPMILSSMMGRASITSLLVRHGALLNEPSPMPRTNRMRTPLICAISNNHLDVVKTLLLHNDPASCILKPRLSYSPIHHAASLGSLPIVKAIVEHKPLIPHLNF